MRCANRTMAFISSGLIPCSLSLFASWTVELHYSKCIALYNVHVSAGVHGRASVRVGWVKTICLIKWPKGWLPAWLGPGTEIQLLWTPPLLACLQLYRLWSLAVFKSHNQKFKSDGRNLPLPGYFRKLPRPTPAGSNWTQGVETHYLTDPRPRIYHQVTWVRQVQCVLS